MFADTKLFYAISALIAIGIVFSLSLSAFTVLYLDYASYHFFIRQLIVGMLGIFIIWFISRLNPNRIILGNLST
ncbi:MAG: FtsW/RodA/SpoVE family cell cycle protein, partial [Campylobacter hyointestinalis]